MEEGWGREGGRVGGREGHKQKNQISHASMSLHIRCTSHLKIDRKYFIVTKSSSYVAESD